MTNDVDDDKCLMTDSRNFFWKHDIDGDGKLSLREFAKLMKDVGAKLPKDDLCALFRKADKNGNGYLEFSEFYQAFVKPKENTQKHEQENNITIDLVCRALPMGEIRTRTKSALT